MKNKTAIYNKSKESAIYITDSKNAKISGIGSKVDATYVSIKSSCPKSCNLKDAGCYAQLSYVGIIASMLDQADNKSLQAAKAEARAIDLSYGGREVPSDRMLRLHVSGDSRTITGTRIINSAISRWKERGGGSVWSYTHAWRDVPRREWSNVSILASINNIGEAIAARENGYASAIIVGEHKSNKAYKIKGSNINWIPCPSQTLEVPCSDCKLCFNADRLLQGNFGIAFEAHGNKKGNIKRQLNVIK